MPNYTTYEQRREGMELEAPETATMLAEVRAYMAAAHLSVRQMATYINYGESTFNLWLGGLYHNVGGTDRYIRKALRDFMDANPIGDTSDVGERVHETENVAFMRRWFDHCLAIGKRRGKMVGIYGGPGSQKTFLAEHLVAELNRGHLHDPKRPRAFYVYCSQDIRPSQLLVKVCETVGFAKAKSLQQNLASLRFQFRHTRVLFVFDEAQHLSIPCLEIIRELNDLRPYFGVMLLGSHEVRQLFRRHAAQLQQWNQRMTSFFEMPGISEPTASRIIREELANRITLSDAGVAKLIKKSYVEDIYSEQKKTYLCARLLFRSIEQMVEAAEAKSTTVSPEVVQ